MYVTARILSRIIHAYPNHRQAQGEPDHLETQRHVNRDPKNNPEIDFKVCRKLRPPAPLTLKFFNNQTLLPLPVEPIPLSSTELPRTRVGSLSARYNAQFFPPQNLTLIPEAFPSRISWSYGLPRWALTSSTSPHCVSAGRDCLQAVLLGPGRSRCR